MFRVCSEAHIHTETCKFHYTHNHCAQLALVSKSITLRRVSWTGMSLNVCDVRCNSLQTAIDLLASSISPASSQQQKIDKYAVQMLPRAEFCTILLPHFWYQNMNKPLLPLASARPLLWDILSTEAMIKLWVRVIEEITFRSARLRRMFTSELK